MKTWRQMLWLCFELLAWIGPLLLAMGFLSSTSTWEVSLE